MKKKTYTTPIMETLTIETQGFLAASIGFGSCNGSSDDPQKDEDEIIWAE